jgi:alkylated DNA repair dioxygenase AlkB
MDLFNQKTTKELTQERVASIKGLSLVEDFISTEDQQILVKWIDDQPWLTDLKRRVQHYGYRYDYRARTIDYSMYLGPLPVLLQAPTIRMKEKGLIDFLPDQAIINEYKPGQGIAEHIDCEPCFGDTIVSLSLLSPCVMTFRSVAQQNISAELLLLPTALLVMQGEARYHYTHGIPSRKKDYFNDTTVLRERRISITYRKIN